MATVRYILHTSAEKTMTIVETPTAPSMPAAQRSPWHSPVPYLFGGLAAMLGLIAFALLILACSYWRLSGYLEGGANNERDLETGESNGDDSEGAQKKAPPVFEEKFFVIMPGQGKPTCLATPMTSRASSFGSTSTSSSCTSETAEKLEGENEEKKQESGVQLQMASMDMDTHETAGDQAQ